MKRSVLAVCGFLFLSALVISGCGGGSTTSPLLPGSSALSVTVTDTPPNGVTVLSFEVSVIGATLNPGNVDLLSGRGPARIEVKQLETESAFLNTARGVPGTYTSLNLTFSNPEVKFKNGTNAKRAWCRTSTPRTWRLRCTRCRRIFRSPPTPTRDSDSKAARQTIFRVYRTIWSCRWTRR